jgi:osmotically-inducible protein OsmY
MSNRTPLAILTLALASAACRNNDAVGTTSTTGAEIADPKAEHQSNTSEDLDLVRDVRQRLVSDGAISMGGKNAIVVVQGGVVTLRGEVVDRVEHDLVIAKVASVPGVVRVDDRLTVAKEKGKKD